MNCSDIIEKVNTSKGYMLTLTVIGEDNKLEHFLDTETFPKLDMLISLAHIKELIIKNLENTSIEDSIPDKI